MKNKFEDEDMAMIARKFRKFFKKSNEERKLKNFKNQMGKKEAIICYEWKKQGHIRSKCPLLNKFKAMVASQDDSDDKTSDEEESHQGQLMAIREELDEVKYLLSYNELFEAFIELHNDLKKICMKNVSLKKKML